jgi:hypothetical protein
MISDPGIRMHNIAKKNKNKETFTMPERPPERVGNWLDPLAEDGTGFQFGALEEILWHELEMKIRYSAYYSAS